VIPDLAPKQAELGLLVRTAAHLRPAQVAHRARLRTQRAALTRWPDLGKRLLTANPAGRGPAAFSSRAGWPAGFAPLDASLTQLWPSPAELASGKVTLLGTTGDLSDWQHADAPQLWRFHLHYWDWAWGLAAAQDQAAARAIFARLWRSWRQDCPFGRGDAWLPYPAALRAWSWCGQYRHLVAGSDLQHDFQREIWAHAGFLRRHLEYDVGGNHLIKGLKALAGLGVFLGDEHLLAGALRRLEAQLAVQILPDGGHYERAPAYHCQVLADLIDVAGLLAATGREPGELAGVIARMRRWLGAVRVPSVFPAATVFSANPVASGSTVFPESTVPLLNDGFPVPGALVAALAPDPAPDIPLLVLPETGLIRAAAGSWHLVADVGPPCPADLPAHAHADTLSCLLHAGGEPLLVDTGTSTYAAGPVRDYERSTAAHNTAEVDGGDSTEVWGSFRAGRRARVRGAQAAADGPVTVQAEHDGYRWLPGSPVHRRRWALTSAGLRVDDEITGTGRHQVAVRWHLAPGSAVQRLTGGGATIITPSGAGFAATVTASRPFSLIFQNAAVAAGYGRTTAAPVLTCRVESALPARISTCWRRTPRRPWEEL
jgi:uncharacterized heparinase superfamily protein